MINVKINEWSRDASSREVLMLALAFAAAIMNDLSAQEIEGLRAGNVAFKDDTCCATHDYCDANTVMADCFQFVMQRPIDIASDGDQAIWNEAWEIAKQDLLTQRPEQIREPLDAETIESRAELYIQVENSGNGSAADYIARAVVMCGVSEAQSYPLAEAIINMSQA